MVRQIFLSRVFSSVILATVLVGLSGCNQTASKTEEPKPESDATVEKSEVTDDFTSKKAVKPEGTSAESPTENNLAQEKESTDAKRLEKQKKIIEELKRESGELTPPEGMASDKATEDQKVDEDAMASVAANENAMASVAANKNATLRVDLDMNQPELTEEEVIEVIEEPKVNLGDPLVDHPEKLVRLQEGKPAWVDKKGKRIIMIGRVSQRNAPLEMFVCQKYTKEHESVLAVDTTAMAIHAALLLIGAESGHPVQYQPEYKPATGTPIAIEVIWKDADGKIQKAKAQEWIKNVKTGKPMEHDWVFAGSDFWENKETGERMYLAEQGDFICVSNFPTAMLDLPIKSSASEDALLFQAWKERIPPLGTPVTIVLTPKANTAKK